MKIKNLFSMLAMAGMLFATSCSQDEVISGAAAGDYVDAKFTIETPGAIGTRGAVNVGEGTTVNYVACAVYDAKGKEMDDLRQYVAINNKKAEYSIRLVKGQAYRVAFFAYYGDAQGSSDYYDMTKLTEIEIKDAASNIEHRDAFTNYVDVTAEESMKAVEKPVTLYRPFAQLNLGAVAKDIEAAEMAGVVVTNSKITVSNVYTVFDAYNNTVADGAASQEVTFVMNEIPTQDLSVDTDNDENTPDETFEYLALNYLLVGNAGSEKELTDVTFEWLTADGKTNSPVTVFKNIPVQRNYRTNIIGYLLTNPAVFNITIDEKFEKPDYIVAGPWDGEQVSEPEATATEYLISTPAEWAWLKGKNLQGKNIKLVANLDFGGNKVKGLGFAGEFDGQGHTMSNMTLLCGGSYYSNGLFQGDASGNVTVKNVNIENVVAECSAPSWGYVGTIFGDVQSGKIVTLENVNVKGADLCGVQSVGGLVGFVAAGATLNVNSCSVAESYIHNYRVAAESGFVTGMVGKVAAGTVTFTGTNTINNTDIEAYYAPERGEQTIAWVAAKRVPEAVINGDDQVTVVGGSITKISLDNVATPANNDELATAIAAGKTHIFLADGEYKLDIYNVSDRETLKIEGTEGTKVAFANLQAGIGKIKEFSISNCEILRMPDKSWGMLVFSASGKSDGVYTIENCTFNGQSSQGIYINETASGTTYNILNCTFNGDFGSEGAVTIQAGESRNAAFNVNVTGCTFNSIPATSHKIAVLFTDTAWTLNTDLPTGDVWWRDL